MKLLLNNDNKITTPLNNNVQYFNNFNTYIINETLRNLTLQQFLFLTLYRYIVYYNYSLYTMKITDYIKDTFPYSIKVFNNKSIAPIIEYIEIYNNLQKIFSVLQNRKDTLIAYTDEQKTLLNNLSFDNNLNIVELDNCVEINQILNLPFSRPLLNNSPYFIIYLLYQIFRTSTTPNNFGPVYNTNTQIILLTINNYYFKTLYNYFHNNIIIKNALKVLQYYILDIVLQKLENIFITNSNNDTFSNHYYPVNDKNYTGIEKYLLDIITPTINKNIGLLMYGFYDKLTEYNNVNFTRAAYYLRKQIYIQIQNLIDSKIYLELIKVNTINIEPNIVSTLISLYYYTIQEFLNDTDSNNILDNVLYNIYFHNYLTKNNIINVTDLTYNVDNNATIEIIKTQMNNTLNRVLDVKIKDTYAKQILVNYLQQNDIYSFMTDLLSAYYIVKFLS